MWGMRFYFTCVFYLNKHEYIIKTVFSYLLNVQHILCPRPLYRTLVMVTHNIEFCQSRTASIKLHFLFWNLTKSLTVHDSHIKPVFTAAERKWDKKNPNFGERCRNSECLSEMKTCECSRWEAEERTFLIYMLMRETGHQLYRWLVRRLFYVISCHSIRFLLRLGDYYMFSH